LENIAMYLSRIEKNFGGIRALKGVDFELKKGEIHALLGENGAGKSTLVKIITGVHKADGGEIFFDGKPAVIESPIDARKKGIGAIYQELSLIESITVAENIFLGNEPTYSPLGIYDRKKLYQNSQEYLKYFDIDINCKKKVSDLGMGQKRIVEIVKALALDAKILILDEPTTGMSQREIDTLFKILKSLREKNVTMIYISHYLEEVFRVCDRATVFRDGMNIETFDVASVSASQLIKAMIGRDVEKKEMRQSRELKDKSDVLELKNFKTDLMCAPISLKVRESEILGITGIVGSGKSELAQSIFGNAGHAEGEILLHSKKIQINNTIDAKKYKIAFIPEDRKTMGLFLEETIADNLVMANIEKTTTSMGLLSKKIKNEISGAIGEKMRIKPLRIEMPARNLSGGNQQKVVIGKWLIGNPDLILMDEPTRGIDVGAKGEIYDHIMGLSSQNKAVIILSSEFNELIDICDRIIVLKNGVIAGEVCGMEATSEVLLNFALGGNLNVEN